MKWLAKGKPLIQPNLFSEKLEVKTALICFEIDSYDSLIDAFNLTEECNAPTLGGAHEGIVGDTIVVYRSVFGAPAAGMLMEALNASGIERIVMVGVAGSLTPSCRIGDIVIPTWGIREEGTSYHYLSPDVKCRPSQVLLATLKESLSDYDYHEGGVWTTDALFRETVDKISNYSQKGALVVEMECTALMSIAMYRKVEFAAVLIVTDELFHDNWVQDFKGEKVKGTKTIVSKCLSEIL